MLIIGGKILREHFRVFLGGDPPAPIISYTYVLWLWRVHLQWSEKDDKSDMACIHFNAETHLEDKACRVNALFCPTYRWLTVIVECVVCTQTCVTTENQQRKQKGVFFGPFPNNTGESRDYLLTNKVPFSETWQLQTPPHPPFLLILHKASHVGIHCNIQGGIGTPEDIGWLLGIKTGMTYNYAIYMPFFKDSDLVKIQHWFSQGNLLSHNYSLQIIRRVYEEMVSPR